MSDLYWTTEDGVKVFYLERHLRVSYPQELYTGLVDERATDCVTSEPSLSNSLFRAWTTAKQREGDGWEFLKVSSEGKSLVLDFARTRRLTDGERRYRERWIKEYTEAGGIIVDPARPASLKRQVSFEQSAQPLTEGEATPDPIWNINNV